MGSTYLTLGTRGRRKGFSSLSVCKSLHFELEKLMYLHSVVETREQVLHNS